MIYFDIMVNFFVATTNPSFPKVAIVHGVPDGRHFEDLSSVLGLSLVPQSPQTRPCHDLLRFPFIRELIFLIRSFISPNLYTQTFIPIFWRSSTSQEL
jgi:hypothetical protein